MTVYTELPPLQLVKAPKTLRQSWLKIVDQCPHSAYLSLKHGGGVDSHPLFRGRAFHEVVERATRACVAQGEQKIDHHLAKAILQEVLLEHVDWVVPAGEMDDLRMMVYHWAEHFVCPVDPLVEQLFHLKIGDRVVSGTVDLAWCEDDTLHIRDYKTGRSMPSQGEISGKDPETGEPKGAKSAQLIIYALLMLDGRAVGSDWLPPSINRVDARLVFPFFHHDEGLAERGLIIERPELIEHREWLTVLLNRADHGFEHGVWPAVPGSQCGVCPAPQECPIPAVLRRTEGISPYERDPSELAEDLLFMEQDVKRRKKELKSYCQVNGPVDVGSDLEASHKTVNTDPPSTRFGFHKKGSGF